MENLTLITYTHSDYMDIWPLVIDAITTSNIKCRRIFATNDAEIAKKHISGYDKIIEYTDTFTYPQKIIEVLSSVETSYILFIHDIDIIVNMDTVQLCKLVELVVTNSIDRCSLGAFNKQNNVLVNGDISITNIGRPNISPQYCTPYDVAPSIWKVSTMIEAMTHVKECSYREIEESQIQQFLCNKKIFGLSVNNNARIYQIGRPYCTFFTFLHILLRGQWMHSRYYMDLEQPFLQMIRINKIDISRRGIIETPHLDRLLI